MGPKLAGIGFSDFCAMQRRGSGGRSAVIGPRSAAFAGLLLGAALWNPVTWQLGSRLINGPATPKAPAGCTALSLHRPSGRILAQPCAEPRWLESALPATLASATRP